jgi:hypothetical protein
MNGRAMGKTAILDGEVGLSAAEDSVATVPNFGRVLLESLQDLRPKLALAAQSVYDEWDASDQEFGDCEVGFGGICHLIADAMASIIGDELPWACVTSVNHQDEVHVSLVVWVDPGTEEGEPPAGDETVDAVDVDISPYRYERGGGYEWTKIENVTIRPEDVTLYPRSVRMCDLELMSEGG